MRDNKHGIRYEIAVQYWGEPDFDDKRPLLEGTSYDEALEELERLGHFYPAVRLYADGKLDSEFET